MGKLKLRVAVAGRGAMGQPLLARLKEEGHDIVFSCTRTHIWVGDEQHLLLGNLNNSGEIAQALDPFIEGVEVMFLAVPSGEHELALIQYCLQKNIYVILFCKHALASHYATLRPDRHMLGANATVGGRLQILPWLRAQFLEGKEYVIYGYLNASSNAYMDGVSRAGSRRGQFQNAQDLHLAEPGSTDFVSFLNVELGGDYRYKASIIMNDAILRNGPFMTPADIAYRPLDAMSVRDLTMMTSNFRYVLRIDNLGLGPEWPEDAPGSLYANFGGFAIRGGFVDMSRANHLTKWFRGDAYNGIMIRFEGDNSDEGTIELVGLGAGTATVGAAMNDLAEYIAAKSGVLLEAKWSRAA